MRTVVLYFVGLMISSSAFAWKPYWKLSIVDNGTEKETVLNPTNSRIEIPGLREKFRCTLEAPQGDLTSYAMRELNCVVGDTGENIVATKVFCSKNGEDDTALLNVDRYFIVPGIFSCVKNRNSKCEQRVATEGYSFMLSCSGAKK